MGSPEHGRSYGKQNVEDSSDVKSDRDDIEWEGSDKRKHRSSKSRKSSNVEEGEGLDSSGRRRSSGDKSESRKRSNGSSKAGSDDDSYDTRKERNSKQVKKNQEVSALEKLSSWYQDGELYSRQDSGDKLGGRAHIRSDENERRKISSKLSEHESSRSGTKSKEEKSRDRELEKISDRVSGYSERRESIREKGHGSSEQVKNSRRRWDDADAVRKADENHQEKADLRIEKASDSKHETTKERSTSARNETIESKSRGVVVNSEKGYKSDDRGERRVDTDRSRSKGRSETLEDDRGSPVPHDDRSGREKIDKYRQQRTPTNRDATESREKSAVPDEDGNSWMREKIAKDLGHTNRISTPEKSGTRHQEADRSEMDHDRSIDLKWKELEKDGHRENRSKGRDDNWSDRNREWEDSKELWERRPPSCGDKGSKDGDILYDHGREWELPRHGRDRNDNEMPHGRSGNRKDGSRGEAVKTSNFSNENYDVIEIRTKPDYGRAETGSNFVRRTDVSQQSDLKSASNDGDWPYMRDDGARTDIYGSGVSGEDLKDRYLDDGTVMRDPNSWKDEFDYQGGKGRGQKGAVSGRGFGGHRGSQPPYGNQESVSFGRAPPQGVKGTRVGRGGRGRPTGRDNQQVGLPLPIMGSPFGPLGMPPHGPMQPLTPSMSPAPGPPISPGVFIPPFSPPIWPRARGIDMNMLGVPPGLSPIPPGPSGPRFPPNMGNQSNPPLYFNQTGPERGMPPSIAGPGFNSAGPMGRGGLPDNAPGAGGWVPPRNNGPPGKAPSRGEQNDYSQNFVDTGMRPQNFIRELELTNVVEDYPKLRELIQKKDEIVTKSATPPMYFKCDLREFELSPEFFGTKFDVILVDPPWEEYVHRAPGIAEHTEYWTFEEILNLKIEAIADTPSFIFLWVGDGVGLEQGRQCLKKWGFRRCEDICWVQTNKSTPTPSLRHDSHTLFQHSKEHCLMGIKGTIRRSTDGHIIHANIDTDVIIAEEPPYGSTQKPEDMYRIVEHFALGRRRIELFGEDHNIRSGWLTVGKGLSSSNFNAEAYIKNFADMDGKVWQGEAGRNPPPEAPHLVLTTPEIESLRPKSPMKNQQQQSTAITLTTPSRRADGNSPQNPGALSLNQEASSSCLPEEKVFDIYGYGGQTSGDYLDFESHRPLNLL
ncbi:hypothetical protein HS088_TW18G01070 [Tripterygium wilfordii]|uniref:Methyltransferase-like protein 1 n=1 Tax=Tripterygium wilfordii TaxID=458696 RepID=A0A7J7CF85_TRIWF|nr:N6-adenosine-methyltransferase non-catalytic subunit MTB-like [Tripterygium wilfordii]XP_038683698.1 N6-adenosine-methyltransferase non-catalytic subunit MTB-like [Tripterygium wilfordii]XP_038683699.1 N6-adenosine-methyltransferase non-catalytic subunit MTB-like [Tripterygium wilfordii]XP_038683700.1 N6-adenosine-methyltransferase non-catalytic subunit MTB-like [Tripterygium wilfordii]XP_038683701.1 N6-adenosine-methyltransferase non-catalytic subunit MTB-like [Tripterygium wilfordii]XP_03